MASSKNILIASEFISDLPAVLILERECFNLISIVPRQKMYMCNSGNNMLFKLNQMVSLAIPLMV